MPEYLQNIPIFLVILIGCMLYIFTSDSVERMIVRTLSIVLSVIGICLLYAEGDRIKGFGVLLIIAAVFFLILNRKKKKT